MDRLGQKSSGCSGSDAVAQWNMEKRLKELEARIAHLEDIVAKVTLRWALEQIDGKPVDPNSTRLTLAESAFLSGAAFPSGSLVFVPDDEDGQGQGEGR